MAWHLGNFYFNTNYGELRPCIEVFMGFLPILVEESIIESPDVSVGNKPIVHGRVSSVTS